MDTKKVVWLGVLAMLLFGGCAEEKTAELRSTAQGGTVAPLLSMPTLTIGTISTPASLDRELTDDSDMQDKRERLVSTFIEPVVKEERVIAAMSSVPRHSFVPTDELNEAYGDYPLPIGYGQTISQPSLVAMMTEMLQLEEGDRVLEIGTGSGYQAAILRELTSEVYSVEIIPELANTARAVLDQLGYADVHLSQHDGYYGWEEFAPYDAIIVTAAPDHLPPYLVAQLKPDGGRMVIPIGPVGDVQSIWLIIRRGDEISMERLMDVLFVPLVTDAQTETR
jgi:protein-L-isoaspartate(D-aspartate) O-methyltransferase